MGTRVQFGQHHPALGLPAPAGSASAPLPASQFLIVAMLLETPATPVPPTKASTLTVTRLTFEFAKVCRRALGTTPWDRHSCLHVAALSGAFPHMHRSNPSAGSHAFPGVRSLATARPQSNPHPEAASLATKFPFRRTRSISNRHSPLQLKRIATHSKQTPQTTSNRHFWPTFISELRRSALSLNPSVSHESPKARSLDVAGPVRYRFATLMGNIC
jgi:hypothetical protein